MAVSLVPCVRVKPGVRLDPVTPAHGRMLCNLDMTARMMGLDLTVTCGREGHNADDPHTLGKALDVRTLDIAPDKIVQAHNYLDAILGDLFTVLYEVPTAPTNGALRNIAYVNAGATAPHFHVQVKKGRTYPPQDEPSSALKA